MTMSLISGISFFGALLLLSLQGTHAFFTVRGQLIRRTTATPSEEVWAAAGTSTKTPNQYSINFHHFSPKVVLRSSSSASSSTSSSSSNKKGKKKLSRPERKALEREKKLRNKNTRGNAGGGGGGASRSYSLHSTKVSALCKSESTAEDVIVAIKRAQKRHDIHDIRNIAKFLVNEVDNSFAYGYRGSLLARLAVAALHMSEHDSARRAIDVRRTEHRDSMLPMESAAIIRGLLRVHNVTDAISILDDELKLPDEVRC